MCIRDSIVPVHTVCIIGTTDVKAPDPDHLRIPHDEVQEMFDAGEVLVPGFRQSRALHAWAGARPLVKDSRVGAGDTRHMSRGMSVLDHSERDGLKGLLTISGGKLAEQPFASLDDLRRQLRLGMGPCQGGFCAVRATGVAHEVGTVDIDRATGLLRLFLKHRWLGLWPILYGDQVRQTALDNWIFSGTLDVEHLPE